MAYTSLEIDELEQKKWLISRIDILHQVLLGSLNAQSQRYANIGQKIISKSTTKRNYCLSALGIALSVLVGVSPIYDIDVNIISYSLAGIFVIGIIVFVIFTRIISKVEEIFEFLENQLLLETEHVSESHGFLTTSMAVLSNITLAHAFNYLRFSALLGFAVLAHNVESINKYSKKFKKYPELKTDLDSLAKNYKPDLELITLYYDSLYKTKTFPPNAFEFLEKTLKPIIDKHESKNKDK